MLQGLRNIGKSWVGKVVVTILFALLIVSFAIWGIGDIFRGGSQRTVARVGEVDISADAVRNAYQTEVQRLSRQARQPITPERARLLGIDSRVLSRLVTEAVLDERARSLGLAVSDELVARSIMQDETFKGADGQFSRALFDELLRNNSLTAQGFEREQRATLARLQIAEAVSGQIPVPLAAREALHRYGAERRSAAILVLPPAAAGEIPAPTEEQVKAFYEERKGSFRAPEYRTVSVLALNPRSLARPAEVAEADLRARYEQVKGTRFGTPERRTVQQIGFPTPQEAEAAAARIKEGAAFEAVAAERGVPEADLTLGAFSKAEMLDPAVAEAAFALPEGGVSGSVAGRFGPALVRVTKVEPESVRPFEEVAGELREEIALDRARAQVEPVHDAIEDQRAAARPLADIARERGLSLVTTPPVDRQGRDARGNPVEIPEREALLPAAFATDIGADNEALRPRGGGYVWYDVTRIDPARDRPLEEVREAVVSQWREEEVSRRLADKARELTERLDKGETPEALGAELGLAPRVAEDLARNAARDELPADAVQRIFATPVGRAGSAAAGADGRVVFRVTGAAVPPFVTSTQEAQRIEDQFRQVLADDLLAQYIAQAQQEIGVQVNQDAFRRAISGGDS